MVDLVKSLSRKMKGFSRKETVAYYQDIIERAWKQVEAADTPEVKSEKYDEVMEWTMLDKDYDDRTRRVFTGGPVFVPIWWGRYRSRLLTDTRWLHPAPAPGIHPAGQRRRAESCPPARLGFRCLGGQRRAELLFQRDWAM